MFVLFLSTFPNKKAAQKAASFLVENNLAACVSLIPQVESLYKWKGKLTVSKEILIIGKTTKSGFKKIKSQLKKFHPYEVPELIALDIKDGHKPYLDWMLKNCTVSKNKKPRISPRL